MPLFWLLFFDRSDEHMEARLFVSLRFFNANRISHSIQKQWMITSVANVEWRMRQGRHHGSVFAVFFNVIMWLITRQRKEMNDITHEKEISCCFTCVPLLVCFLPTHGTRSVVCSRLWSLENLEYGIFFRGARWHEAGRVESIKPMNTR